MSVGLIVEGQDDSATYPVLVRKILDGGDDLRVRQCGGLRRLKGKFVPFLKELSNPGYGISKAIVIRDSDCNDSGPLEQELVQILQQSRFVPIFPVYFHATKCKLESLLLADEQAIVRVARARGNRDAGLLPDNSALERLRQADSILTARLSSVGLPADSVVFSEIAAETDLATMIARCPHFKNFVDKLRR